MFGSKREEDPQLDADAYYRQRLVRAARVCKRFPGGVPFSGKSVIEIGSGFGALATFAATQGATRVLGIDPDPDSVQTANELLCQYAPSLRSRIEFRNTTLDTLGDEREPELFDIAVSSAVFEHVPDPLNTLRLLRRQLRAGGRAYLGIGPLYCAPWGDHRRTLAPCQRVFPWAHLAFPESWLIKRRNRLAPGDCVNSVCDLGLNQLKLDDYLQAFESSGMSVEWWKTNNVESAAITRALNLGMKLPGMRDLLAINLYAVLAVK